MASVTATDDKQKRRALSREQWWNICNDFRTKYQDKLNKKEYLTRIVPSDVLCYDKSAYVSFTRWLKKYDSNELLPHQQFKRSREGYYPAVEKKLAEYIHYRRRSGASVRWNEIRDKALQLGSQESGEEYSKFKATPGWIKQVLRRSHLENYSEPLIDSKTAKDYIERLSEYGRSMGMSHAQLGILKDFSKQMAQREADIPNEALMQQTTNNEQAPKGPS